MKKLFIMRHADANFNNYKDIERKLSLKGIYEAESTSKEIAKKHKSISFCLCSKSERTKETLSILSKNIKFQNIKFSETIYETNKEVLFKNIENFEANYESAMIIAHNPSVSNLLNYLTGSNFYFETSNIVEIDFNIDSWNLISNLTGTISKIYNGL